MSVLDFIGLELPKITSAILTYSAKAWVSKESPIEDAKLKLALGGNLQLSDPDYALFGRLTSLLRQNIFSAIKVMASKKDEEGERAGEVLQLFINIFSSRNFERYMS